MMEDVTFSAIRLLYRLGSPHQHLSFVGSNRSASIIAVDKNNIIGTNITTSTTNKLTSASLI